MHVTPKLSNKVKEHWVSSDLLFQQNLIKRQADLDSGSWKMLFWPKAFAAENMFESLDHWALTSDKMFKYGKQVTKLRIELRKRAIGIAEKAGREAGEVDAEAAELIRNSQLGQWDARIKSKMAKTALESEEPVPPGLRKKTSRKSLTLNQKVQAAYMVFFDKEK